MERTCWDDALSGAYRCMIPACTGGNTQIVHGLVLIPLEFKSPRLTSASLYPSLALSSPSLSSALLVPFPTHHGFQTALRHPEPEDHLRLQVHDLLQETRRQHETVYSIRPRIPVICLRLASSG